jgi:hypothetical protein
MCLVPPFQTGPVDDVADALSGEEVRTVEYHLIWNRPSLQDDGPLSSVRNWEIAWMRLLFQLLVVLLVTGGVGYVLRS